MIAPAENARPVEARQAPCLHLLLSPDLDTVQALQGFRVDGDVVVLLGTAVILLADGGNRLGQLGHGGALYAHRADVLAQGLPQSAAEAGVALIDDEALLGLVARFPHTLSWK